MFDQECRELQTMKTIASSLLILLMGFLAAAQDKPIPNTPGMYYSSPSGPTRIELATNSGFKTTGVAKSAFSYGIVKAKGKWLYGNPGAIAQLSDQRPVFTMISQIDVSTQAIALVRFDVKKDHREAQYFEYGLWTGAKEQNKDVIPVTVTRIANSNNLSIVPQTDLSAGEYLLITDAGKGSDGYDFGVK
jgi:hypothetical protein